MESKTKNYLIRTILVAVAFLFVLIGLYGMLSFIEWKMFPGEWNIANRIFFAVFGSVISLIFLGYQIYEFKRRGFLK